jgi:hypothetical protein
MDFLLKTNLGKAIIVETMSTIFGTVLYKGYKEYCKFCWKKFYK